MSNADEIILDMEWVETLQNIVAETKWDNLRTVKPTIFRVPKHLRDNDNSNAYDPICISLGPYHRHEERLQAMHNLKWHCLKKFLNLDHDKTLADYLKLMKKLESQARIAYSEDIVDMNSNDFALMLLLDGCFVLWIIIFLFLMSKEGELEEVQNPIKSTKEGELEQVQNPIKSTKEGELEQVQNPIKSMPWALPLVARDMLALENQLPFLILDELYDFANFRGHFSTSFSFVELAFIFFNTFLDGLEMKMPSNAEAQFHHLLHLVHSCVIPLENQDGGESSTGSMWPLLNNISSDLHRYFSSCIKKLHCYGSTAEEEDNVAISHRYYSLCMKMLHCYGLEGEVDDNACSSVALISVALIPTATQLMEAGVQLKRKKKAANILDITFKNGKLEIPQLVVDDYTNKLFRNLIAFEQCYEDVNQHFTLYQVAMDCIIDTAADVVLLQDAGIIANCLGDSKGVSKLFNNLGTEVTYDAERSYLSGVFMSINNHCNKKHNKWRARLNHDYFSNPWAIISVVAAIVLFVLTITQTIYTVLAYLRSP
ncbi:UPF0481 protein [Canna indica]|uniref:UPF0481 protein n=1 Tax=Canna indica TaxID=4628 RepID=A0AAQ3KDH9_9LILI|nr:UPF0481 protein [Canna indica]